MMEKILACRMVFSSMGKAHTDITIHLFLMASIMKQLKSILVGSGKNLIPMAQSGKLKFVL